MSTRKKVRLGQIEADPGQFALVVNYNTEIYNVDENGNMGVAETQPGEKIIRLPRGLHSHDLARVAHEVVEKCKYIPASKVNDVERLLYVLRDYEASAGQPQAPPQPEDIRREDIRREREDVRREERREKRERERGRERDHDEPQRQHNQAFDMVKPKQPMRQEPLLPDADPRYLEDYADALYEERMELKVQGAKQILRICTEARHLEFVVDHEISLLGVLSRELRESSKKSFELSVAIVCTFLCFSHFSQFHQVLMQHQCGDVTMRVVEYESQRHQVRKEDMSKKIHRVQELGEMSTAEDRRQLAKDEKKYRAQLQRQNRLMHVCQMVLLNLAEEISIEKKMVNRKMPLLLVQLLDRTHEDLLLVALQFLKKLSVFEENKEQISTPDTLARLVQLSSHGNIRIALLALRVLYNLSFDESVRASLVESGMVKLLVDHLRNPPFRHIVLRLLYHFSMDDRCKSLMAYYQDGMVMLLQLVVHFPEPRVGKDLVALVVNLATHPRAAEVMVQSGLFPQVMLRVLKTRDPLLCKVIRHVSCHKEVVEPMYELLQSDSVRMSKWMTEFVRMALCCVEDPNLLVEVLGTLANMTLPDIPWAEHCEAGLVDLLHRLLVVGFSEDDIVLECVMLVGNLALSREASQHIAGSRLPSMLQDLLVEKREDEEIILQLLFTFNCLLVHDEVRDVILQDTEIAPCIMRFARSRNKQVLEQASQTLQAIAEYAGDLAAPEGGAPSWTEQIKAFRFEQHNAEWCHYVNRELSGGAGMSPSGGYNYYDEEQDSEEGEEEFAFHWAGGDAGDVQDLANRDWGNKDLGGFMHSSRYVT